MNIETKEIIDRMVNTIKEPSLHHKSSIRIRSVSPKASSGRQWILLLLIASFLHSNHMVDALVPSTTHTTTRMLQSESLRLNSAASTTNGISNYPTDDSLDTSTIPLSQYRSPILQQAGLFADGQEYSLWEQIKLEAQLALQTEPEVGTQIYQFILSQPSLLDALSSVIAQEIETELIQATQLVNLIREMLSPHAYDLLALEQDVIAAATRSASIDSALTATLHNNGLHALVAFRVGHRLWKAGRKGLAYYLQSTVSRRYSADLHPACTMGVGIYLKGGAGGVVIGETAKIGHNVSILQGVTLGGTGKERGDRHPKVGDGVILGNDASVLGNIPVGDGAVVTPKSIVTKPVEPLAVVTGVPAKVIRYRSLINEEDAESEFNTDLSEHLAVKYLDTWKELYAQKIED